VAQFYHPFTLLRAVAILLLTPLLTLLTSSVALVGMGLFRISSQKIQVLPRLWGKIIVGGSGVRVSIKGLDKLEKNRPYIFAANHQSQFDIFALQGYLEYDFRWMAKKELFSIPVFGPAMRMAGYIPVDRAHGRKALKSLEEAAKRIADGTAVIVFPEGTRSKDGRLQPFKSGAMILAIKAGVPLVPMAIAGSHAVLPKGALLAKPGKIVIRIGDPIDTKAYSLKQKTELAERLHETVARMLAGQEDKRAAVASST